MSDADTTIRQLREDIARFVDERDWRQFHDPKNLAMSVAIEAAELMEHFQWVRSEQLDDVLADDRRRGEIADEIADVTCYVLALINVLELDLATIFRDKLARSARKYPADEFRGRYHKPEE